MDPEAGTPPVPRHGGRVGAVATAITAGLVAALWAITWAGSAWRAPPATLSLAVTFLPYLYGAVVIWLFALWTAIPDRRLPPVLLVAVVLSGAGLWGPGWPAAGEDAEGDPVRVMSWNVRRLWGGPGAVGTPEQRVAATACVVDAVEADDPDVVALLEVSRGDVAQLSARLGLSCAYGDYTGVGADDVGGIATCVRGGDWTLRRGGPQRFVDDEPWYYVFAEVERGGRVFNLLAVHLKPYRFSATPLRSGRDLVEMGRAGSAVVEAQGNQSAALIEHVSRFRDPTIVAGDFNSTRDTALHDTLRDTLVDAWERGGRGFGATIRFLDRLPLRVDYVYVTPSFAVVDARVPSLSCSDHRPVVTDLVLRVDARAPGVND